MKYFAYGSNVNKERMLERELNFTSRQFAKLHGYKLMFNKVSQKQGMVSNIEQSNFDFIEYVLYEFPDNEISKLDEAEGYPNHYDRIKVTVVTKDGTQTEATTYIAKEDQIVNGVHPTKSISITYLQGKIFFPKTILTN